MKRFGLSSPENDGPVLLVGDDACSLEENELLSKAMHNN